MIRMLLVFVILFVAFWFGISGLRGLKGLEAWQLTKLAGYSILCASLSLAVLILIVILF